MGVSDWIQSVTSSLAVIIAIGSLWWSIKIQSDENKPYVVATLTTIRMHGITIVYLIVKNYGKTGAFVRNFRSSKSLRTKAGHAFKNNPFEKVKGTLLAPSQSMTAGLTIPESSPYSIDVDDFQYSFEWRADRSKKWKKSSFSLDLASARENHAMTASPANSSHDVAKEVDKLVRAVVEGFGESTLNRL